MAAGLCVGVAESREGTLAHWGGMPLCRWNFYPTQPWGVKPRVASLSDFLRYKVIL